MTLWKKNLLVFWLILSPVAVHAQSLDEGLSLYKDHKYEQAVFTLYDVLLNDADPDNRDQAQIYLAEGLRKLELYLPALFYYSDLFKIGPRNRYYFNAIEGLLDIQRKLHDHLIVPNLINEGLNPDAFGQLDSASIAQINYMIGELSFRQRKNQDAQAFLEYVADDSRYYPRARYLLGILNIRRGQPEKALAHFGAISQMYKDTSDEDHKYISDMSKLAAARVKYGLGQYREAAAGFKEVPRFSESWFTAMYENSWAYFRLGEYGKALGELQSSTAPYFSKRHMPEAYVVQGTTYFVLCQWDRVRLAVDYFKENYDPMLSDLRAYLEESRAPAEYYRHVIADANPHYSIELARSVRSTKRFKDFHYLLTHIAWEKKAVAEMGTWRSTRLQDDLTAVLVSQQEQLEPAVGNWARMQLRNREVMLQHFQNQINILDFEVTDAERKWLEQGKEILKGRRARLPRPAIPDDQWQHWGFRREYWKDEIGYIEHAVRSECF